MKKRIFLPLCLGVLFLPMNELHAKSYDFTNPFQAENPQPNETTTSPSQQPPTNEEIPEGLHGVAKTIWKQDYLTGDWDDERNQLLYKGFAISPVYQGEVMGNPSGGMKQGVIYDGVINTALDIDLERITDWWKDARVHANALYIQGSSLSQEYVGDFSNTSNLAGYNSVRLQELWFEQGFWLKRGSVRIGNMAVDNEFFNSASASLFLNGTYGAFTFIGSNVPNAPVYPVAAPGIRLRIQPISKAYFMTGVYAMDNSSDPATNNQNGIRFNSNSQSGLLWMNEIGFLLNQSPNERGLQGNYSVGSFVHTYNYNDWNSQAQYNLGTGSLASSGPSYGVYGVLDQQVYKSGGEILSYFVRSGGGPSNTNFVDYYIESGFNFAGFIPGRLRDVGGIAVARSHVSDDFSNAQVLQGGPAYSAETVIEATYRIQLAPWWSIQPDFQYIVSPSGISGTHDATVLGVRTTVVF